MSLDRDELTARFAVEYAVRNGFHPENAARQGREAADALLAALTPTPAPVAPPAGKYVPAVGDIVIGLFGDDGLARVDSTEPLRWSSWGNGRWHSDCEFGLTHDARLATDAEKRDAGLAVPPQATATCPGCGSENRSVRGWIRVRQVDDLNSDALLASEDFPVSHRTIRTVRCTARFHTSPPAPTPAPEVCCASPLCPHSSPGGGTSQVGGAAERDAGIVTPASSTPAPEAKRDGYESLTDAEYRGALEAIDRTKEARAAFDKDDAPEAKRPEWVRITRAPKDGWRVTTGKVYPVARWSEDAPLVTADDGTTVFLSRPDSKDTDSMGYPAWEPAPCPPPVAGRGEDDVRSAAQALIDEVERMFAAPYAEGVLFHREFKALKAALSRPVRP